MNETESAMEESPKTDASESYAELPISLFPATPKVGDTISLTVASVDEQSGMVSVEAEKSEPAPKGSQGMAEEFQS